MPKTEVFRENGRKYNYRNQNGVPYWRQSKTIDGKQRFFYGDGEKDCLTKIKAAEEQAAAGIVYEHRNAKAGDALKTWLFNVKRIDHDLKASSFSRYAISYKKHIVGHAICNTALAKLTTAVAQNYVNELWERDGCSVATIKNAVRVWKMFISYALDEGYLAKDPFKNVVIPGKREKGTRKIETFSAEERAKILETITREDYWYGDLIRLAFITGMRQGELLALRYSDIRDKGVYVSRSTAVVPHTDGEGNSLRYREVWDTKTVNSDRFIPLSDAALEMLATHRMDQTRFFVDAGLPMPQYVFVTDRGNLVDPSSFSKSYSRMLDRAGVPYRKFHAIRHTFATEAIRAGVKVTDLQMLMGHSNISTTMIYVHPDEESKREAIDKIQNLIAL